MQFGISGSYDVKIQSFQSKMQAVFGNDPQCRAPNSGRRKIWSSEGIKVPLHLVRRPGHHYLDGHHQLGRQLDDHLMATQPEQHRANKCTCTVNDDCWWSVQNCVCCKVVSCGLSWVNCALWGLGYFCRFWEIVFEVALLELFGIRCTLGFWAWGLYSQ